MNYGKTRIFDSSGENNLTRGIFLFICFQKLYAIQTVNLGIIVEEIIQEYSQNLIRFYITEVMMIHNVYFVRGQDMIHAGKLKLIMKILLLSSIFMVVLALNNIQLLTS